MANKFNPGDRVRFIERAHPTWYGREGFVIKYDSGTSHPCVMLDDFPHKRGAGADDREHWIFNEDCLALIEDPLVAELTAALAPLFVKDKHDAV